MGSAHAPRKASDLERKSIPPQTSATRKKLPIKGSFLQGGTAMKEFLMDTIFVYATLIGGIIAILFAVVKKRRVK
jgi:hypothetical protein